ncbi:MAG: type II secretion system protein [Candidatus Moraniibacteriota bacterium]
MPKENLKAFTLIEVMLVVAIIAIISSVSWLTLNKSKKNVDVSNACTQVAAYINKTRNYVISGRATQATVKITGANISITGDGGIAESYMIRGAVDCGDNTFNYVSPNGIGIAKTFFCKNDDTTKTVEVSAYNAVCK